MGWLSPERSDGSRQLSLRSLSPLEATRNLGRFGRPVGPSVACVKPAQASPLSIKTNKRHNVTVTSLCHPDALPSESDP